MLQHSLEAELHERVKADAEIFDFVQHHALDGLWFLDVQHPTNHWVNATGWLALGYGPSELPADPGAWQAAMHPDDRAAAQLLRDACLQNPAATYEHLGRYTHLDGSTVWLRSKGLLLRDAAGVPSRLLGTMRNVTLEKGEAAYSREVATHYSRILGNQSVYIVKIDLQGNYTYVNEFFYEQFAHDQSLLGTSSLLSIVEEDRPKCMAVVMQCFAEPEVPHQVILRKFSLDNSVKSNHWELKGILGPQGQVVEILCLGYDVTLLVENLHKSQHLLDVTSQQNIRLQNFAYIVSHNIRSHSANLTSLAQLLQEAEDEEQRALFLQMLQTSTHKLAETIVNLSDIVTVNGNVSKPKERRLLKAEIDKTLEALSVLIRQHHIAVDVQVPADLAVTVVPAYLDSILLNLISNAVKYRSPHRPPTICLRAYREPGSVVLTVQDNGLGLDLVRNRSKLFGMYKTFHDNEDARGVGLFLAKNQIEAMHGSIGVESAVGEGSTFKVCFNETV